MSSKTPSLIVFLDQQIVFQSDGKWLHPLFALEEFLVGHPIDMTQAMIYDKVVGKAAAMLIARLGVGRVYGELMSVLAIQFFESLGTPYAYDQVVDRIDCKTETILLDINDINQAYQLLCRRAKRC